MIKNNNYILTLDGEFLLSSARMSEQIHLYAHLADRSLVRSCGVYKSFKLNFSIFFFCGFLKLFTAYILVQREKWCALLEIVPS